MKKIASKSDLFLENKSNIPHVSTTVANSVSQFRKEEIAGQIERGEFSESTVKNAIQANGMTRYGLVASNVGRTKFAQVLSNSGGYQGNGDTIRQGPDMYSPLWLNSNMNMPRDRATINSWLRSFYALNPFVHNAINLHSTYPISKLNIKCPNKKAERFFSNMIEEIDLMNICVEVAKEFWLLGESFVSANFNETTGSWDRLVIQNPDYIDVKLTAVSSEPMISIRVDQNLKRIVFSNSPSDVEQRKLLPAYIIDAVKKGQNIPLDNYSTSHLSRKTSPYEARGTGLPVSIFRQLILFDKLRECYSMDTEVLTDQGFKLISDLVHETTKLDVNSNFVNGAYYNESGEISILAMKEDFKVACFNSETSELEYHKPQELHMSQYEGEMYNFTSRNYDVSVTPNHKMWVSKKVMKDGKKVWNEWHKEPAKDMCKGLVYKFRGNAGWTGEDVSHVTVLNKEVPIDLYLKTLAYIISEGYVSSRQNVITLIQKYDSDCFEDMKKTFSEFASIFNKEIAERTIEVSDYVASGFKKKPTNRWSANIYSKELALYFENIIGSHGKCTSEYKIIPQWVKQLPKNRLNIFLDAIVRGDGSHIKGRESNSYKYYTSSRILADDIQEIAYKCGWAAISYQRTRTLKQGNGPRLPEYIVAWSDSVDGQFPNVDTSKVTITKHEGVVWCFEVPTGLFVTRRNGKITIQGNSKYAQADNMINPLTLVKIGGEGNDAFHPTSADIDSFREAFLEAQYDKDFKLFTHAGVTVEKIGSGAGIYDISGDITQLQKEIYVGLQVPSALMDGGADTTYANAGVALDTLRQRYMQFRNMMSHWLRKKIFAPIAEAQEFYEFHEGEKRLIIPEIDWNYMSLFDAGDYTAQLVQLTDPGEKRRVSNSTLYRSLGLEFEDEVRKMKKENIQAAIELKEKESLAAMDLNALRALSDEDEIPEMQKDEAAGEPLPGQDSGGPPAPPPGLDLGGPPAA